MPQDKTITVEELLRRVDAVSERMSARSEARAVLAQCRVAITYLAGKQPDPKQTPSGLYLP